MPTTPLAKAAAGWSFRQVPGWVTSPDLSWADWTYHGGRPSGIEYGEWLRGARPRGYSSDDLKKARDVVTNANPVAVRKALEAFLPDGPEKKTMLEQLRKSAAPSKTDAKLSKEIKRYAKATAGPSPKALGQMVQKELSKALGQSRVRSVADLVDMGHTPEQRDAIRRYANARTIAERAEDQFTRDVANDHAAVAAMRLLNPPPPFRITRAR